MAKGLGSGLTKRERKPAVEDFINGAEEYSNRSATKTKDEQPKEPLKRLNIEIPESLHKEIKLRSVEEGRDMRSFVLDALNAYLKKTSKV